MGGTTKPSPENLQMNIWSTVWADPREMYEDGYSLINMQNNHLYIIPGGGYDRLDVRELYENWAPNRFYDYNRIETIPSYSPQMLGASYMIWNDMSGRLDLGICEYDLLLRFRGPLPTLSVKLWGASRLEEFAGKRRESGCETLFDIDLQKIYMPSMFEGADEGADDDSYPYVEPEYEIKMKVRLEPDASGEQILAEGDGAYGKWAFYAAEPETGKVGFAREGKTYTFDCTLPKGEWVNLTLWGGLGKTILSVEGETIKTVDILGSEEPFEEYATFVFPMQRVGRQTGCFDGDAELKVTYSSFGSWSFANPEWTASVTADEKKVDSALSH